MNWELKDVGLRSCTSKDNDFRPSCPYHSVYSEGLNQWSVCEATPCQFKIENILLDLTDKIKHLEIALSYANSKGTA